MANKLWKIEDSETGKVYQIEGPEDASEDEVYSFLEESLQDQTPAQAAGNTVAPIKQQAPVEAPLPEVAPAGPSGVQPQQMVAAQGLNPDEPFTLTPEAQQKLDLAAADPSISYQDYSNLAKQLVTEGGGLFAGAGSEEGLAKYREALQGGASASPVGVENYLDTLPTPEATVREGDGVLDQIGRGYEDATQYGTPGFLARLYHDWTGTGMDALRSRFPDATPDQLEALQEAIINRTQKGVRAANQEATEDDNTVLWLLGQIPGSAGVEDFIPGGQFAGQGARGIAKRAGIAAGVNTGADVAYQAGDIASGVQDEYNVEQTLLAPVVGAAFQGGIEGLGALASSVSRTRNRAPRAEAAPSEPISVPTSRKRTKAYKAEIGETANQIVDHINRQIEGWKNAPDFEVHQNFKKLDGIDDDALGVTTPEGKVLLNAENIIAEAGAAKVAPEDIVSAVTYHEALGHHGLAQKFGDELEDTLASFVTNGSKTFKDKVSQWLEANPDAYKGDPNRDLRAAEELLAEWSEQGRLPVTFVNRLTNVVKDFARQMGLNLKVSERELRTILGMAHNAVINGHGRSVSANGFRYMKPDQIRLNGENVTKGTPGVAAKTFLKELGLFNNFELRNMPVQEAIDRAARLGIDYEWLDYYNHAQWNPTTKEVDTPFPQPDMSKYGDHGGGFKYSKKQSPSSAGFNRPEITDRLKREDQLKRRRLKESQEKSYEEWQAEQGIQSEPELGREEQLVHLQTGEPGPVVRLFNDDEIRKVLERRQAGSRTITNNRYSMRSRTDQMLEMMHEAEATPGRVVIRRNHYGSRLNPTTVVDFRYVDPKTREEVYGSFRPEGDTATEFEAYGSDSNAVGPTVVREVRRQLKERFPELTRLEAERISGARHGGASVRLGEAQKVNLRFSKRSRPSDFKKDNPGGEWLESKQKRATADYNPGQEGVKAKGLQGSTTGYSRVNLPVEMLTNLRGVNNEDSRVRGSDRYNDLVGSMRKNGYDPESRVMVWVNHFGEPYLYEGNHRVAAAVDAGVNSIPVEIQWRNGAEDVEGPWSPDLVAANEPDNRYSKRKTRDVSDEDATLHAQEILTEALDGYEPTFRSWEEAKRERRARGLTASDMKKLKGVGDIDRRLYQYDRVAQRTNDRLLNLLDRRDRGEYVKGEILQQIATNNEVIARILDDQGEVGRALNVIKNLTYTRKNMTELNEVLKEMTGNNFSAFASDDVFNEYADRLRYLLSTGNTAGVQNMVRSVMKPYWWQYILSYRHAAMLSGLGTHVKNTYDNAEMIVRELEETVMSTPLNLITLGKVGAAPQEGVGRLYGLLRSALDGATYKNTFEAFKEGHPNTQVSTKIEMADAHIPGISKVQDALHAADIFFRAFHTNANLYALGVREARKQGFKGLAMFEEGSNLAANPTKAMRDEAKKMADVALLVDSPSAISDWIEVGKSIKPGMKGAEQARAAFLNMIFPFFRVSDRLLFQALRRSPLGFLDRVTRQDLAAGGERAGIALARMAYGSALIYYYWQQAGQGNVEGAAPADYEKEQALQGVGYLPNSVKEDGKYVDASALNLSLLPDDLQNATAANIASIRKAYDSHKADGDQTAEALGYAALSLLNVLASNSFAENISTYTEPFRNQEEARTDTSVANVGGSVLSQSIPAAIRQYNQLYFDTVKRDTTGDKTIPSRIEGRLKSAIPGLSDDLPVKYDVLGDPMQQGKTLSAINNYQNIKSDPVGKELGKLERSTKEVVVEGAPSSFEYEGERIKMTAAGKQEWQRVQGYYIRIGINNSIQSGEWKAASKEEKIAIVKEVKSEAYTATKEYMLPLLGVTPDEETGE